MAWPVRSAAAQVRCDHLLAEADGLSAERTLINRAILGARERNAEMLQFQHRGYRLAAHIFDRILVAEPVGALDRVVHVKAPIVAVAHIAERSRPCAATVWLRVGNTFVTQAVRSPDAAMPS